MKGRNTVSMRFPETLELKLGQLSTSPSTEADQQSCTEAVGDALLTQAGLLASEVLLS